MRQRPASRLLIIDPQQRVLLFRFKHKNGPLAGQTYWATPGGGVEDGESLAQAALRELHEETGIVVDHPGSVIAERRVVLMLPNGEEVEAVEHYFLIHATNADIVQDGWTEHERNCMSAHRWWSISEIRNTAETIWPETLLSMLHASGATSRQPA